MKDYCIIYFEHRNDVISIVKLHEEYSASARILFTNLHYASRAISMFKINYTTAFHGISVKLIMTKEASQVCVLDFAPAKCRQSG